MELVQSGVEQLIAYLSQAMPEDVGIANGILSFMLSLFSHILLARGLEGKRPVARPLDRKVELLGSTLRKHARSGCYAKHNMPRNTYSCESTVAVACRLEWPSPTGRRSIMLYLCFYACVTKTRPTASGVNCRRLSKGG